MRAMPTSAEHLSLIRPSSDLEGAMPLYHGPTKIVGMKENRAQAHTSIYV